MLRGRQNKSSKSPLSEPSTLSTSPTITIDNAPHSFAPLQSVSTRSSVAPDHTSSSHLLIPSASTSNWRRWWPRPGGSKSSTAPSDTLPQVKESGHLGRKSRDSTRPLGDTGPPPAPPPPLRKSGSAQLLSTYNGGGAIKQSGSRLFGRRSTVTSMQADELVADNAPPLPTLPLHEFNTPVYSAPVTPESDLPRPSMDGRQGLSNMSKKPWSRSVDDFSRILGINKTKTRLMTDFAPPSIDTGSIDSSTDGSYINVDSPQTTASSFYASPISPIHSDAAPTPRRQLQEVRPQGMVMEPSFQPVPFPVDNRPSIDEPYKRKGIRRKTNSLSGSSLLSGVLMYDDTLPQRSDGSRLNLLRGPGKASTPPTVDTSFLTVDARSPSMRPSESAPDSRSRPHRLQELKGQPGTRLSTSASVNSFPKEKPAANKQREGENTEATSRHGGHQRTYSYSLLNMAMGGSKAPPQAVRERNASEGPNMMRTAGGGSTLETSASVASLSKLANRLPAPSSPRSRDSIGPSASPTTTPTKGKRTSQIIHRSGLVLRHTTTLGRPSRYAPSPGGRGQPDHFSLLKNIDLHRGWKPYKAVLKGNKVYLYKPPTERKHAIENLFPMDVVAAEVRAGQISNQTAVAPPPSQGRARRAYLNTGKHHELLLHDQPVSSSLRDIIKGGTLEALVHEMIFTTQRYPLVATSVAPDSPTVDATDDDDAYRAFIQVVLMAYPSVGTPGRFFDQLRVYTELAAAALDGDLDRLRRRLEFILQAVTDGYITDCRPESSDRQISSNCEAFLASVSQYVDTNSLESLRQAIRRQRDISSSSSRSATTLGKVIAGTQPDLLARTLGCFHTQAAWRLSGGFRRVVCDNILGVSSDTNAALLRALAFGYQEVDFLARTVISDILQREEQTSPGRSPSHTIHKEVGARIRFWIGVAQTSKSLGNTPAVVAITLALGCAAVMRLSNAWSSVSLQDKEVYSSLADILTSLRIVKDGQMRLSPFLLTADGVPYFGNLIETIKSSALIPAMPSGTAAKTITAILDPWWSVKAIIQPAAEMRVTTSERIDHDPALLAIMWSECRLSTQTSIAVQYALSVKLEPARSGATTAPTSTSSVHGLGLSNPLAFIEPVPFVHLRDSSKEKVPPMQRGFSSMSRRNSLPLSRRPSANDGQGNVTVLSGRTSAARYSTALVDCLQGFETRGLSPAMEIAGNELVLRMETSAPRTAFSSRPNSILEPATSRRESWHLDQSIISINVDDATKRMSAISKRDSVGSSSDLPPLGITVTAGSLDRLVDILICGFEVTGGAADDNGLSPLAGTGRRFCLPLGEYRGTFLATYRMFCGPLVLFEYLKKRYDRADQAVAPPNLDDVNSAALQWLMDGTPTTEDSTSPDVTKHIHSRILDVFDAWLLERAARADFLDCTELHDAMVAFLLGPSSDNVERRHDLLTKYLDLVNRPQIPIPDNQPIGTVVEGEEPEFGRIASPQNLVQTLEVVGRAVLEGISREDLFQAACIVSKQSMNGWFKTSTTQRKADDDSTVRIDDCYTHLTRPLVSDVPSNPSIFLSKLPISIQNAFKAFMICRQWLELRIDSSKDKVTALTQLVEALTVCGTDGRYARQRSGRLSRGQPVVPTFAMRVLVAAIVSPVSRQCRDAWSTITCENGCAPDASLTALVGGCHAGVMSTAIGAVDIGWVVERLVEISERAEDQPATTLIDFAQQRLLLDFINGVETMSKDVTRQSTPLDDLLRILMSQSAVARRPSHTPRAQLTARPPFQALLTAEREKLQADELGLHRLLSRREANKQRLDRRELDLDKLLSGRPRPIAKPPTKLHKRAVTAAIKHFYSRPLSSAMALDHIDTRTASELDFDVSGKPFMVIPLPQANDLENTQRSFVFTLATEDGLVHVMQATTLEDRLMWVTAVNKATVHALEQRRTFLSAEPILENVESVMPVEATASKRAVFRVDLTELMKRETEEGLIGLSNVPAEIQRCFEAVEQRGLLEQGVYRVPGSKKSVDALQSAFDRGLDVDLSNDGDYADIHIVCGVIKSFFRLLPEPLLPTVLYDDLINAIQLPALDRRLSAVKDLIWTLPPAHFALLRRLMDHLEQVTDFEESNQMPPQSLAMCFAPNLLRPPTDRGGLDVAMINIGKATNLIKLLITEFHWLFSEEVQQSAPPSPLIMDSTNTTIALTHDELDREDTVETLRQ